MGVGVRQAGVQDVDGVAALFDEYRQLYGCVADVQAGGSFLAERIGRGDAVVFLARDDAEPVGFALMVPGWSSVALARTFVVNDVYVRPGCRRRGTGKALMAAVTEFARDAGATGVSLSTELGNQVAQKLYRAAGWVRDEQFCTYHYPIRG